MHSWWLQRAVPVAKKEDGQAKWNGCSASSTAFNKGD
ncbi:hypothetical protein X752_24725 [Mesorhizobium sp. LNJC398B00]|nr:hypothetical protein X752_24725 [Mesorhizobium sp. LNJC398B00]ESZ36792.1 hypothetical protein X732_21805 [Mesorhizobium sp. L2C066B000]ESZ46260.1 hypothetical protein X731_16385 [Mesorhizobium sp. L2C054A000]